MYKLLIVDDDEVICKGLGSCIPWKKYGIGKVHLAYDGEMAMEYVGQEKPDIVIADINMPFMDGLKFSQQVRQKYPEIKIILLTAYKEFQYARQAVQLQIFEYLTKPFTNEEVLEAVLRAIEELEKNRSYHREVKKNLELIKEKNLEEMVLYGRNDKEVWKNSFLKNPKNYFQVAILYLNRAFSSLTQEQREIMEGEFARGIVVSRLRQLVTEEEGVGIFVQSRRNVLVFEYDKQEEAQELTTRLNILMEELEKEEHIFLTVGVGRVYCGIEEIICSYCEAAQAIEQRHGYGNRSIIYYSQLSEISTVEEQKIPAIWKTLREGVQRRDVERIKNEIGDFFKKLSQFKEKNHADSSFQIVELLRLAWEMTEDQAQYEKVMRESGRVLSRFLEAQNLAELEERAQPYFSNLYEYLQSQNMRDIEKRVNQAVEYIRENYPNPELSLEEVARTVSLSSSYLGNSIKKYKKISYVNLLNQIRIDNAKKFLANPNTKTYEVAFLVGFNSSQYFSSCFKRSTGMTPKEFREDCQK